MSRKRPKGKRPARSQITINQAAMEALMSPDKIRYMCERGEFPPAVPDGDDFVVIVERLNRWLHAGAT